MASAVTPSVPDLSQLSTEQKADLIEHFQGFLTENRRDRFRTVLSQRTRQVTVVLEDIYQPHNASAVLRSCDGFGVQDIHTIESRNDFAPNRNVSIGADRWLNLHRHKQPNTDNTTACLSKLKSQGYTLVATTPHTKASTVNEIPIDGKVALLFGTELTGLTQSALDQADAYALIPMSGFSESFNISVSVALCLYDLTTRLRQTRNDWHLTEQEQQDLYLNWVLSSIKARDQLLARYWEERQQ
ncbi:MAG: RNA methyltransferase [Cyanobacteria bacterium P01_F01_bin.153]